jgi:hypothetical protein
MKVVSCYQYNILKNRSVPYSFWEHITKKGPFIHITNLNNFEIVVRFLLGNSPASEFYMPTFRNALSVPSSSPTSLCRWNRQSVPKRWHIKFRLLACGTSQFDVTYSGLWTVNLIKMGDSRTPMKHAELYLNGWQHNKQAAHTGHCTQVIQLSKCWHLYLSS